MDWFRWHHGSVNDPKFQLVAKKADASVAEVIAVWACLLEAASAAGDRGNPGDPDFDSMDCALGFEDGKANRIYERMNERALIAEDGRIVAWDKRQPKREREDDSSTERVRAFREKQRQETPGNASDDTETPRGDKRREEEKEKDPPATRVPRATRKCPEAFVVTGELREWASEHAPAVDLDTETAAFRDYTFRNSISDWSGAWRNWMRKAKPAQPTAKSFRERDTEAAAAEVAQWTGNLLDARRDRATVIDMEDPRGPIRIAG